MNKDNALKKDPRYGQTGLRERITEGIKRQRDDVREVKDEKVKSISKTPGSNQDDAKNLKHYRNKI